MKQSLSKFANHFESRFKERGRDLYEIDAVSSPTHEGNTYYFEVRGNTDVYDTSFELNDKNEVEECNCTCPHFTSGHLCKHLYASLLKLDEVLGNQDDTSLSFLPQQARIIDAEFNPVENKATNEKKKTFTSYDLTLLKSYCSSVSPDKDSMLKFLNIYDLNSENLVTIFQLLRKERPMKIFISAVEKDINEDFMKKVDLTAFPKTTNLNPLLPFCLSHPDLLGSLKQESLNELFHANRITDPDSRISLLFACLAKNVINAIAAFFSEEDNSLLFFQEEALINYMRKNMTKEECLFAFKDRIKKVTLTDSEAAFIYPYLSDDKKANFDLFFRNHYKALRNGHYSFEWSSYSTDPMDRGFHRLLSSRPTTNLVDYDIKSMYYLKDSLFTCDDKLIFAKRFKQLAVAILRSKDPDLKNLYCCLKILLEYEDSFESFDGLAEKALDSDYLSKSAGNKAELNELVYQLAKKHNYSNLLPLKEYKLEA